MHRPGARLAGVLALALSLASCGRDTADENLAPAAQDGAAPIVLRESTLPGWQSVSAEVSTVDQAVAAARIPGVLVSLNVREGDYVKRGQVIGRIVDSQLGYQSGAYGAQAAAAQAQAAQAQAELQRTRYLYENGVYAKARLEQAQAASSAAQAQVRAARQQQAAVNAVAGQGAVVAPTSGRVLVADIPAGSAVAPGMPIATITSGPVVLRLELPETLADKVRAGTKVRVTTEDGSELTGTVARLYPAVAGGQVRADAEVSGLDARLIGRRLAADIDAGTKSALVVPDSYVTTRYGIDYVTVRAKDGSTAIVPVQTAPSGKAGTLEILSGVTAGDVLVKPAPGGAVG
ncbi:efflux RND transporter periplasmic adaptor subunit [Qipengyuania soli]|uniref:Efflux RND transporter periplasmic adaptor subunit n=1 Tax=Qipengyuania soli TaxID=2782568 RepID=A0A7S8ISG5_9SPHN|nr:efflux RND transporter periplasmic adaptor subunit [Qipengyuania soli]QPC98373.1 efflux RND transporter periplasmic adaptor subunit [Qipengyuania soli]